MTLNSLLPFRRRASVRTLDHLLVPLRFVLAFVSFVLVWLLKKKITIKKSARSLDYNVLFDDCKNGFPIGRGATTSDKTCWDTYTNTYFLHSPWQKCLLSQIKRLFPPSPIAMLFAVTQEMHAWTAEPKQHCTRGGEGDEFVPFGHDDNIARNWKLYWNVSTVLSGVVAWSLTWNQSLELRAPQLSEFRRCITMCEC